MAKKTPLNEINVLELLYLIKQFNIQKKAENSVSIDLLPYTSQIKWITGEMSKKFPKSQWTEKLVHRTLIRIRKADMMDKNDQTDVVPVFAKDSDLTENEETLPCLISDQSSAIEITSDDNDNDIDEQ